MFFISKNFHLAYTASEAKYEKERDIMLGIKRSHLLRAFVQMEPRRTLFYSIIKSMVFLDRKATPPPPTLYPLPHSLGCRHKTRISKETPIF
jgi:hypothetical protein